LKTGDRRGRLLIFLIVLVSHVMMVLAIIRAARLIASPGGTHEPLIITLLQGKASANEEAMPPAPPSRTRTAKRARVPDTSVTLPPEVPPQSKIDWAHEIELASQNLMADAEKDRNYRNLAGLSPAQRDWIQQNHMEPAPPGIAWQRPRFEFDRHSGLPIFWINDHCVLVTLMIFCGIGHIPVNGELFKHMRDPQAP
jgi:hypothetical protein